MKCNTCGGNQILLLTSWVCDTCDPVKPIVAPVEPIFTTFTDNTGGESTVYIAADSISIPAASSAGPSERRIIAGTGITITDTGTDLIISVSVGQSGTANKLARDDHRHGTQPATTGFLTKAAKVTLDGAKSCSKEKPCALCRR